MSTSKPMITPGCVGLSYTYGSPPCRSAPQPSSPLSCTEGQSARAKAGVNAQSTKQKTAQPRTRTRAYHASLALVRAFKSASLKALASTAIAALTACRTPAVGMGEGPREYVASDYELVLKTWTRSEQLTTVSAMDNVLTVTATYESWDFRWAYAVRYAEDYRLTVD